MFHFTSAERNVILFLLLSILLGSCVIAVKKRNPELIPDLRLNDDNILRLTEDSLATEPRIDMLEVSSGDSVTLGKININTADVKELSLLPGIGERTATRIIEHRREIGYFRTIEGMMDVSGIGPKTFDRFKDQITVGTVDTTAQLPRYTAEATIININLANAEALMTLSGVGQQTAQRIIDYRTQTGGFRTIDELKNVPGIGDKTFERLRDQIIVGDEVRSMPEMKPISIVTADSITKNAVATPENTAKININTATMEELQALPGIGEKMAQNIIAYRTENGVFPTIDALKKVKGIGDKKFEALKPFITVE